MLFSFFQNFVFFSFQEVKGQKMAKNSVSRYISGTVPHVIVVLVHICKMISPAFFFIFFKILIFSFFSKFINKSHLLKMCVIFVILYHFFSSRKDLASHLHLQKGLAFFCFVVFNSSGNQFHSCTNIYIAKVIDPCNLLLYQVILSFCLIVFYFVFRSKNEFTLEICQVQHFKKKRLSCGK